MGKTNADVMLCKCSIFHEEVFCQGDAVLLTCTHTPTKRYPCNFHIMLYDFNLSTCKLTKNVLISNFSDFFCQIVWAVTYTILRGCDMVEGTWVSTSLNMQESIFPQT